MNSRCVLKVDAEEHARQHAQDAIELLLQMKSILGYYVSRNLGHGELTDVDIGRGRRADALINHVEVFLDEHRSLGRSGESHG